MWTMWSKLREYFSNSCNCEGGYCSCSHLEVDVPTSNTVSDLFHVSDSTIDASFPALSGMPHAEQPKQDDASSSADASHSVSDKSSNTLRYLEPAAYGTLPASPPRPHEVQRKLDNSSSSEAPRLKQHATDEDRNQYFASDDALDPYSALLVHRRIVRYLIGYRQRPGTLDWPPLDFRNVPKKWDLNTIDGGVYDMSLPSVGPSGLWPGS